MDTVQIMQLADSLMREDGFNYSNLIGIGDSYKSAKKFCEETFKEEDWCIIGIEFFFRREEDYSWFRIATG